MAKVLRSNVKVDDEIIPAGTKMSNKVFSAKLRKQLKETGFFVEETSDAEEEEEDFEEEDEVEEVQDTEEG